MSQSTFQYEDILNIEYKKSNRHPHMSEEARAAQFSPFAALTGLEDAIEKTTNEHIDSQPGSRH